MDFIIKKIKKLFSYEDDYTDIYTIYEDEEEKEDRVEIKVDEKPDEEKRYDDFIDSVKLVINDE